MSDDRIGKNRTSARSLTLIQNAQKKAKKKRTKRKLQTTTQFEVQFGINSVEKHESFFSLYTQRQSQAHSLIFNQ